MSGPVVGIDGLVPVESDIEVTLFIDRNYQGPAVYQINPSGTNKEYIGSTKNFKNRLKQHLYSLNSKTHENYKLQNEVNKCGKINIVAFPVETREIAYDIEKKLILEKRQSQDCLNIKDVSPPSMTGKKHSEETKNKIREHHKQMYENGYVNPFKGKTHSEESINKQIKSLKKTYIENPDIIKKMVSSRLRTLESTDLRERISETMKNKWQETDYRNHQLSKRKEQFESPEFKKQLSDKAIERMKNPEVREISRQAAKEQWKDPEFRAMMIKSSMKPVVLEGIQYESVQQATEVLGITYEAYRYRYLGKRKKK